MFVELTKNRFIFAEWYRGVLIYASADRNVYDVIYDDGEEDLGLCRRCVRPFIPYKLGESVEVRIEGDTEHFELGRVVALHPNELYDITLEDGFLIEDVPTSHIRRFR